MHDHDALLQAFGRYSRTILDDYTIEDVLYPLTDQIVDVLRVDGSSVCLFDDDRLVYVTSSNERVTRLDRGHGVMRDAPCYEACRSAQPVSSSDLAHDARWPEFATVAVSAGLRALLTVPMSTRNPPLGVITVYREQPEAWQPELVAIAQLLADMAAGYVTNARVMAGHRERSAQLQHALESRIVIEQAKGIIAERERIDLASAFGQLRAYARDTQRPLHRVAVDVVRGAHLPT